MNKNIARISLFLMFFGMFASNAAAFRAVETTSTQINETTYLLTHTYTLGFLNAEMSTPVLAGTGEISSFGTDQTVFNVTNADGADVQSIVMSGAVISDGQYVVGEGERREFTLVALVKNVTPNQTAVGLKLQSIPYSYLRSGDNQSEEGAYTFNGDDEATTESAILVVP